MIVISTYCLNNHDHITISHHHFFYDHHHLFSPVNIYTIIFIIIALLGRLTWHASLLCRLVFFTLANSKKLKTLANQKNPYAQQATDMQRSGKQSLHNLTETLK